MSWRRQPIPSPGDDSAGIGHAEQHDASDGRCAALLDELKSQPMLVLRVRSERPNVTPGAAQARFEPPSLAHHLMR